MSEHNTIWEKSVAGVVLHEGRVLLARHTYGAGKGMLIVPGGYVQRGESPEQAVTRELAEETGIAVKPVAVLGIRFNMHDWYVAFRAEYVSGTARSDGEENSEVLWLDAQDALAREDVPELSKRLIEAALGGAEMPLVPFRTSEKYAPTSLYLSKEK